MKKQVLNFISFCIVILLFLSCKTNNFNIVITNGLVYDGEGHKPVNKEIGILDGRIAKIGDNLSTKGATVIDAKSLIVAPGFIDIHTHCNGQVLNKGMNSFENYLKQGVTTVITGNCGGGTYKVNRFYQQLDSIGIGANIVHLVGHNTIRSIVMGMDDRAPTDEELEQMKQMVKQGIEEGAAGFSTGLFYTPGKYSKTEEVIELAKVAGKYNRFYASHIRDESNYTVGLEEAVKEAIQIGEQADVRVEISHIKALGKPVWGMSGKICSIIEEARNRGVRVWADQYPYNASSTGLSAATIPGWVKAENKIRERLTDTELLPRIKKEVAANIERRGGPESLVIVSYPKDERFSGKNLLEISKLIHKSPVETAIILVLDDSPGVVSFNMQDSDIINFMKKDYVMTCSDGNIEKPNSKGKPHPRSYGAFARKIRKYAIEDSTISIEHAIRAATSLPANMIGLTNRGSLKEGKIADIVIFDPKNIDDVATFNNPHQYSKGVEYLLIKGNIVVNNGKYNGKLAGEPIRLGKATHSEI